MRYELLGPLRVVHEQGPAFISARKVELLLATLLIRADQVVTVDELFVEIWGGALPTHATAALYVYVSQRVCCVERAGAASDREEAQFTWSARAR